MPVGRAHSAAVPRCGGLLRSHEPSVRQTGCRCGSRRL